MFSVSRVLDYDALGRRIGADEEFVLSHLAVADQRRRLGGVLAELAPSLNQKGSVGGGVCGARAAPQGGVRNRRPPRCEQPRNAPAHPDSPPKPHTRQSVHQEKWGAPTSIPQVGRY